MSIAEDDGFISIIRKETQCVLEIHGTINKKLFYIFRRSLEEQISYYKYRNIHLYIESPGGDTAVMSHMLDLLRKYTNMGVIFHTVAGSEVFSAAAILFSLGQVKKRFISSYSKIVYHRTRTQLTLPEDKFYTSNDVENLITHLNSLSSNLTRSDSDIAKTLALHLFKYYSQVNSSPRELVLDFQKRFQFLFNNYLSENNFLDSSSQQYDLAVNALVHLVTLMNCEEQFLENLKNYFSNEKSFSLVEQSGFPRINSIFDSIQKNQANWKSFYSKLPVFFEDFFWRSLSKSNLIDSRIFTFSRSNSDEFKDSSWIKNYFHLIYRRVIDNPSDIPINPILAQLIFLADVIEWPTH